MKQPKRKQSPKPKPAKKHVTKPKPNREMPTYMDDSVYNKTHKV